MARDCPECSKPVDGFACRACGWRDIQGARHDPTRFRCCEEERGMRCGKPGSLTWNTVGDAKGGAHPGPWFCAEHYPALRSPDGKGFAPRNAFEQLRDRLAGIKPPVLPDEPPL